MFNLFFGRIRQSRADAQPTTVSATGSVGTITASIKVSAAVTGEVATFSLNSVTVNIPAVSVSVTGVSSTSGLGNESVTGDSSTSVTGVSGTGSVGDVTNKIGQHLTQTGVEATVSVNDVIAIGSRVQVTTVAATGSVGDVVISIRVAPEISSAAGATGSVGSVTVLLEAVIHPTTQTATGSVGSVTVTTTGLISVSVTGVSASFSTGTAVGSLPKEVLVDGNQTTSALGDETVNFGTGKTAQPTGVEGTGSVGEVTADVIANIIQDVDGVEAIVHLGLARHRSWDPIVPTRKVWEEMAA